MSWRVVVKLYSELLSQKNACRFMLKNILQLLHTSSTTKTFEMERNYQNRTNNPNHWSQHRLPPFNFRIFEYRRFIECGQFKQILTRICCYCIGSLTELAVFGRSTTIHLDPTCIEVKFTCLKYLATEINHGQNTEIRLNPKLCSLYIRVASDKELSFGDFIKIFRDLAFRWC